MDENVKAINQDFMKKEEYSSANLIKKALR